MCKTYLTTNSEVHDFKYNVHKNKEVSVLPTPCARQTFMKSTDEKVRRYRVVESFVNLTTISVVQIIALNNRIT